MVIELFLIRAEGSGSGLGYVIEGSAQHNEFGLKRFYDEAKRSRASAASQRRRRLFGGYFYVWSVTVWGTWG